MATLLVLVAIAFVHCAAAASTPCKTSFTEFPSSNFSACATLPGNGARLAWSWDNVTRIMSAVFSHSPEKSGGWIAWGINHNDTRNMVYSSALACYPDSSGTATVQQFFLTDKTERGVVAGSGLLNVVSNSCLIDTSTSPQTYHLKFEVNLGRKPKIYQVYGAGPGVELDENHLEEHADGSNVGTFIDIRNTTYESTGITVFYTKQENTHGVLNAVGWGVLIPVGAMISRYFKIADPLWFYLHASVQTVGYALGTVGFAYGLWLWEKTSEKKYTHRNLGIIIFALATLQILVVLVKPKKDASNRIFWNLYHWSGGFAVIILAIVNNLIGFSLLKDEGNWRTVYLVVLAVLGGIALILEVVTWIAWLRKSPTEEEEKLEKAKDDK